MNVAELRVPEKGTVEMYTTVQTVSPDQAQAWLDAMPAQRRLRAARVDQLRRLIDEGRWKLLPHGIVFDREGHLIDGMHRMTALVQAGRPLPVRCTYNADKDMFLDIGGVETAKTIEDMLRCEGVSAGLTSIISLPIKMLFRNERGFAALSSNLSPSNAEAREVFIRHPRLIEAGEMAVRCRLATSRALVAYVVYKGLILDQTVTRLFVDQIATGEGLRGGDPALLLRNTWIQDRQHRIKREKADQMVLIATTLRDAVRGKKRKTWHGVEFGKGKIPSLDPISLV